MLFNPKSKIEKVVSKDPTAPVLLHPFLRVEPDGTGMVLASDKFSALCIPVELGAEDTAGPVHVEAIKAARKAGTEIRCTPGYNVVEGGVAYPRDGKHRDFPPVDQLLVDAGEGVVEVSLDAKTLLALAQAMGTDTVTLRIQGVGKPVGVEPHVSMPHVKGARAAMMPFKIPGSL